MSLDWHDLVPVWPDGSGGSPEVGMRRRSAVLVGVLGLTALVLVLATTSGEQGSPQATNADAAVLRATGAIARGTSADTAVQTGLITTMPRGQVLAPAGAATSPGDLQGLVAVFDIPADTVLSKAMFAAPARLSGGLADRLVNDGHVALALTVDATRAVGGWLRPGDLVNVMASSTCPDELGLRAEGRSGGPDGELRCRRFRHLYQAVRVLAVGPASEPLPGGDLDTSADIGPFTGAATVVVEVPPTAAGWLATASGDLWFTLVAPGYVPSPVPPPPSVWEVYPGEDADALTPYGPGGVPWP
jgi:Flp pilus assembly protein CpaB